MGALWPLGGKEAASLLGAAGPEGSGPAESSRSPQAAPCDENLIALRGTQSKWGSSRASTEFSHFLNALRIVRNL